MPTLSGEHWAQWTDWRYSVGPAVTATVRPNNRTISARAAVTMHSTSRREHGFQAGIFSITSNGNVTQFHGQLEPAVVAGNVTEVVFRIDCRDSTTYANFTIDYWR